MLSARQELLLKNAAIACAFLLLTALLLFLTGRSAPFALNLYLPFSRAVSGFLGVVFSFTRSAVAEILLVLAAAGVLFCFIRMAARSVRERVLWRLWLWFARALAYAMGAVFLFNLLWGGNYYAPKLESRMGIQTVPADEELLYLTAKRHLDDVVRYAAVVPRNADGAVDAGGFDVLAAEAVSAVEALMGREPELFGRAMLTKPKRAMAYPVLGALGISGIYVPFTGEAVVNPISTEPFLPAVMAHELAHRLGFAAEYDANLIAYLACFSSELPIFRYSGALMAFNYCYNALTGHDYRTGLYEALPRETLEDYRRNREAWERYDSPLRRRAEEVNDAYLQMMGQEEGVQSYGRVVDMFIALYLEEDKLLN
jgi:hypothetical protein